jgi:hypothetical protein
MSRSQVFDHVARAMRMALYCETARIPLRMSGSTA